MVLQNCRYVGSKYQVQRIKVNIMILFCYIIKKLKSLECPLFDFEFLAKNQALKMKLVMSLLTSVKHVV